MASGRRIEKINVLLREIIAAILGRDFQFPEGALVTVTNVETSDDLYYATVFISVLSGAAAEEQKVLKQLHQATGLVQRELNRRLAMRPVPRITFAIDEREQRRERIEKLLSEKEGND